MQIEDFTRFTDPCFNGESPSCACACPFGLDVRSFAEKCRKGRWASAWKTYRNAVFFPAVTAALCPAPCLRHCQRAPLGGAVDLPALERAAIDYSGPKKAEHYNIPPREQSVAVVGAGMSGLSAALNIAQKRYKVTVFDRAPGWGGQLRGHERFAEFDEDIALQFTAVEISFRFDTEIRSPSELEGFDAVYLATGEGGADFEGEKFFRGGQLTGMTLMEGMAVGAEVSRVIETYLMTGRAGTVENVSYAFCDRTVEHEQTPFEPAVEVKDEDSARAEAARCMQCDCENCMRSCEVLEHFRKKPRALAREAFSDSQASPPIATQSLVRETYSCTNCGHCRSVCPEKADVGAMLMLSRANRFDKGTAPAAFHDYWLREMDFACGEASAFLAPPGRESCKYVFFPGCRLGMDSVEHAKKAFAFLTELTDGDAGLMLGCCGAPALWAGDTQRLENNFASIRDAWQRMGKPTMVFACASCSGMLKQYLPEIPGISLYELMENSQLPHGSVYPRAVVFDPCSSREDDGMRRSVRSLAARAGAELDELKTGCRCCGYGGHIQVPNPELFRRISASRAEESGDPYIVYCYNCKEVFLSRGKECSHILDVYFGPGGEIPTLYQKRRNALRLKRELLKEVWNMDFTPSSQPWDDIELFIPPDIQQSMEDGLISLDDLRETIWRAEQSGDKLVGGGYSLASMRGSAATYWVQYSGEGGAYHVAAAYSHRMKWRE